MFKNLGETDKFLKRHKLQKVNKKRNRLLNSPLSVKMKTEFTVKGVYTIQRTIQNP